STGTVRYARCGTPKPHWRSSTTPESRVQLTLHARFGKGPSEKVLATGTSLAAYFTARRVRRAVRGNGPVATPEPRPGPTQRVHPRHAYPRRVGQLPEPAGGCVPVHPDAEGVAEDRSGVAVVDGPVDRAGDSRR